MKVITKREYQVISLYSRGLTFKEIGYLLGIATRTAINYYMRVKVKDKGRVTRAKKSRAYNKSEFNIRLQELIITMREYNKRMMYYRFTQHKVKLISHEVKMLRYLYIKKSLEFTYQSYYRFKLNLLKNGTNKETPSG